MVSRPSRDDYRLQCLRCGCIQRADDGACERCGFRQFREVREY